jgi:CMP-N-acetylneuraminic acid synthetase
MKILAIIPARGGSKELPLKNLRKLAGKPLIEHTIMAAKESRLINKILVSTDDKNIAKFSKSKGIEVPFLRPKKYSQSNSPTIDVINHALDFLNSNQHYVPDILTILQPTSPLRSSQLLDKSIRLLMNSKASSVLGVTKVKNHPYLCFVTGKSYLRPFKTNFQKYNQRQKFPIFYYPTGSIYTLWNKTLKKYGNIYGPKIKPLVIPTENSIDIDSLYDLFETEMRIQYWEKYMKRNLNDNVK